MLEKERGVCFHANMTHNKVFFERDKVETANMQSTVNVPVCKLQKKKKGIVSDTGNYSSINLNSILGVKMKQI